MNNKVIHHSADHSYYYGDKKYQSVSRVFDIVKPDTDWDYNAARSFFKNNYPELYEAVKAEKDMSFDHPQLIERLLLRSKISKEEFEAGRDALRKEWKDNAKEATDRGTAFHTKMEEGDYAAGGRVNPATGEIVGVVKYNKTYDNEALCENLYDLPDGYYPELLVFNHELEIAGQLDMGFIRTQGKDRIVDIDDWKTDADILLKPKFKHPKKGYERLKRPVSHLYATNHNTYMIKIGMYAYMLEKFGFKVGNLYFTSVDIDHETLEVISSHRYSIPYKKWEISQIFNLYKK
jgi:hypothetical protein